MLSEVLSQEQLQDFEIGKDLSKTQLIAFEKFKNQESLVIFGPGGVGKSFLIKTIQEYTQQKTRKVIALCATTGVAAYNIGGMTIHSWAGIGTGEAHIDSLVNKVLKNKASRNRIRNTDVLIIDEISMLSGALFEKIDQVLKQVRNNNQFFGGLQVVFTGDLLQMCPVFKLNCYTSGHEDIDTRLIIESKLFTQHFNSCAKNIILLSENFRQKNDTFFFNLLQRIRKGKHTRQDVRLLNDKQRNFQKDLQKHQQFTPVSLVVSNKKAQIINDRNLNNLTGSTHKFDCQIQVSGNDPQTKNLLKYELISQFKQKGLDHLVLKKNARVMLIKNMSVEQGLVNGSIGTITAFEETTGFPIVKFDNGIEIVIPTQEWDLELSGNKAKIQQIPLILAYSITIHKIQSVSLDYSIMDLADCFCDHQVYVALSRLKNFDGLILLSFDYTKIIVNKKMQDYISLLEKTQQ